MMRRLMSLAAVVSVVLPGVAALGAGLAANPAFLVLRKLRKFRLGHVDSGAGRSRMVLPRSLRRDGTAKRRQVPRLRASPVGSATAARFRDCSRPRLAYSERTPCVPGCQYPVRINLSIAFPPWVPFSGVNDGRAGSRWLRWAMRRLASGSGIGMIAEG